MWKAATTSSSIRTLRAVKGYYWYSREGTRSCVWDNIGSCTWYGRSLFWAVQVTPGAAVCGRVGHQAGGLICMHCARTSTGVQILLWYLCEYETHCYYCCVRVWNVLRFLSGDKNKNSELLLVGFGVWNFLSGFEYYTLVRFCFFWGGRGFWATVKIWYCGCFGYCFECVGIFWYAHGEWYIIPWW